MLGTFLLIRNYFQDHRPTEYVMVAARDIPSYAIIIREDLGVKEVPLGAKAADSLQNPEQVIGKMAVSTIFKGEQINPNRITDTLLSIGHNERSVAVKTDQLIQSVGNTITAGDIVDVFWVASGDTPGALLAANARVMEVKTAEGVSLSSPTTRESDKGTAGVVVLIVKQNEVPQLARAVDAGLIYLAKQRATTKPSTRSEYYPDEDLSLDPLVEPPNEPVEEPVEEPNANTTPELTTKSTAEPSTKPATEPTTGPATPSESESALSPDNVLDSVLEEEPQQ